MLEALAQWRERGRIVVEANVEEPDSRDLCRRLGLSGERRKNETDSENDREPDQRQGHLGGGRLPGSLAERHNAYQHSAARQPATDQRLLIAPQRRS